MLIIDGSFDLHLKDSLAVLEFLASFPSFPCLWSSSGMFKAVGIDDSLIRFLARQGIWEQRTDSGRSPIWWPCGGAISEDAIIEYCFGCYDQDGRKRKLFVSQPKLSPRFLQKLIEVR